MTSDTIAVAPLGLLVRRMALLVARADRAEHPDAIRRLDEEMGQLVDELNAREIRYKIAAVK